MWGFSPVIGAFLSALIMSGLVTFVSNRTPVRDDTAIGLLFVGMLALGVLIVSKSGSFATDVTSILFGDALGITREDIRRQAFYTLILLVCTVLFYRPFMVLTFNRDKAQTLGMHPRFTQAVLLALLSLSIVASFEAIGTLLVFGLLVAPPATASLLVRRVPGIMIVSILVGTLAVVVGLVVSFHYGTAGGATMAGFSVLQFFIVLVGKELKQAFNKLKSDSA